MGSIPVIVWGEPSQKVYLHVHGKQSDKESAAPFALLAQERGFQTVSFDLPAHGERRGEDIPCDLFHGMEDLAVMGGFVFENWASPTSILYGGRDDLQSREVLENFARRFHAKLTVSEQSAHPFLEAADRAVAEAWLRNNL